MKFVLIVFILFSQVAFSQQANDPTVRVTKVVHIRYGIPQKIADLIAPGSPVMVNADNILKVVVLKGRPENIASVEQTIHELDVPGAALTPHGSKNVELVVSVIAGSDGTDVLSGGQMPEAMTPVVKQLRTVFPYKNYQLLSSMLLRSSEDTKAGNVGVMKNVTQTGVYAQPSSYSVGYDNLSVSLEDTKPTIHLRNFSFRTTITSQTGSPTAIQILPNTIMIQTDLDLREGQKIVAGKANIDSSDLALFVVLSARIVD